MMSKNQLGSRARRGIQKPVGVVYVLLFAGWLSAILIPVNQAAAQKGRLPKTQNYNIRVFSQYYQAEYDDAGKSFTRGAKSAYKFGTRRHLDSICFWTMMGECYYHMGNYSEAIEMYEQSLKLYLSYQNEDWQSRVQLPAAIQVNNTAYDRARISWGSSQRNASIANEPDTFSMLFGRLDASRALQQGGVVQNAELFKVNVTEIMRCTALCLHRRRTIKGPTCKYDPFSSTLVSGLSVSNMGNGSILGAYNGVLLGIAQASMDDWDRAVRTLKSSLQFAGGVDHSLTPVAMIELAKIGLTLDNDAVAAQLALEASYSAAVFGQFDLVEEALSLGTTIHLMTSPTPYPPLQNAIAWAHREDARMMEASLIVRLAECLAEAGNVDAAANVLRQTKGVIGRRNSLANAVLSARLKYVDALIFFLKADFADGMSRLGSALDHFQTGSLWLYRLGLADNLVVSGEINQRQADLLYSVLLRDPTEKDWKTDPMEAIAFLASSHIGPMERWFDIVVDRKDYRKGLEIADLVRRHRFFAQLPLGGRLMAFRWVMHAPEESLTPKALAQRQDFLNRNPLYKESIDRADAIRIRLLTLPLQPELRSAEQKEQLDLLKTLANLSDTQEAMLASYALRREPAEMAFPPQVPFSEFQDRIGKDQLALVTLATASGYHVFMVNSQAIQYVGLNNSREVHRSIGTLIKKLGLMSAALDIKTLQDEEWKVGAKAIKSSLFAGVDDSNWSKFKELVIIPDGMLWYLPFEALPVEVEGEEKYLSDIVHIRYSPTLFLAFGAQRPLRQLKRSVVVTGRMNSRGNDELASLEFTELVKTLPRAIELKGKLRVPTNYLATLFDQLVVWSEIKSARNQPFAMQPMQIDQTKYGTLQAWMSLPWRGPEYVTLPGFQSGIGTGTRGTQIGNDLFMTSVGLMASGTRTVLISRWNPGGKTGLELTRHYASSIAKVPVSQAILESRQLTRELELDYANEPRVKSKKSSPVLKAEHPFFWAGPMLFSIPENAPEPDPDKEEDKESDPEKLGPDGKPVDDGKLGPDGNPMEDGIPDPGADPKKDEKDAAQPMKELPGLPGGGGADNKKADQPPVKIGEKKPAEKPAEEPDKKEKGGGTHSLTAVPSDFY